MIQLLDYRTNSSLLRRQGKKIQPAEFDAIVKSPEFLNNLEKMKEILEIDGVGLAATQVNWPIQLFMLCIDENSNKIEPQIFINPEILQYSKAEEKTEEGCLSFPTLFMKIKRPVSIKWRYQALSGEEVLVESSGFYARAVQHETDHCHGKVFIDKASTAQKMKIKKWLRG
jgi:peptide deformylase